MSACRRFVRPPPRYIPPTKPLSFHGEVFQGTVHRERIFHNNSSTKRENYLFHRDSFQPACNVIPTQPGEKWPQVVVGYGNKDNAAQIMGWFIAVLICGSMYFLAYGLTSSDEVKNVKSFELSMAAQNSRVVGLDLIGSNAGKPNG